MDKRTLKLQRNVGCYNCKFCIMKNLYKESCCGFKGFPKFKHREEDGFDVEIECLTKENYICGMCGQEYRTNEQAIECEYNDKEWINE